MLHLAAIAPLRAALFDSSIASSHARRVMAPAPPQRNESPAPSPAPLHPLTVPAVVTFPAVKKDGKPATTSNRVINLTGCGSQYGIALHNGLVCREAGEPWDTNGHRAKFVMQADGSLFAGIKFRNDSGKTLHHSSFTRQPVAAAGLMVVDKGRLRFCICESGHYEPTPEMMGQFLRQIARNGMDISGLPVGFHLNDSKEDVHLAWYDGLRCQRACPAHPQDGPQPPNPRPSLSQSGPFALARAPLAVWVVLR